MADLSQPLNLSSGDAYEPKASILIVDDNPANLLSLRALLDSLGQNLVAAQSGEQALQRIRAEEFAVVLLDVLMPVIGGFETARAIRAEERARHTPIIFLTAGDIDRSQLEEAYALGAVDFLGKPLLPVAVQAKVRGFVQLFQDKQRAKQEAEQLRLLVDGAQDYAIFLLDPQGNVASWNPGAERIKGYRAEEIIGQHFSRFYPQDVIDQGWPAHELQLAGAQGRFEDEGWRLRKDGTRFWANVVITALYDEAGALRGFSKITRDMTERKKAEESARRLVEETTARRVAEEDARLIQEQRERLRVTLESIGDAVISTDANGLVEFLNPVAQKLVGWRNEEATGHPLQDVFRIVNENTRQTVENPALRALNEGVTVGLANHTVLISRDGTERPIDDSAAPIRDTQGQVVGSVLVFRDITERRRNEERLREQQEWLRVTLASIGDAVIATDTGGRITFLNPVAEELTSWGDSEAKGQPLEAVFAILNEQTRQPVENPVAKVLRDGAIVGLGNHTVLVARDGTERPIDDSAAPIRNMAGHLIGVVLTFREVSSQRRVERYRNARLSVTQALSEAPDMDRGVNHVLRAVCEHLGWDVGFFWAVNAEATVLTCRQSWHRPEVPVGEFETASCSSSFDWGQGLPGRVWASGEVAWILDIEEDANSPRLTTAVRHDLHSAVACPIIVGDQTLGVIEFFTRRVRKADADLLEMMGTVCGQVGQFLERRRAETELRESERRFRTLADHAPVGIFQTDAAGNCLLVNERWSAMAGMTPEQARGQGWANALHPKDRERVTREWYAAAAAGQEFATEYRFQTPAGKVTWLFGSAVALRDEMGKVTGHIGTVTDITQRKQAQEQLQLVTDSMSAAVTRCSRDLRYLWVSRPYAEWLGRPVGEIVGRRIIDVLGLEAWNQLRPHFERVLSGEQVRYEEAVDFQGLGRRWVNAIYTPTFDTGGAVDGWVAVVQDVENRRQMEDALRQSERRFRQLADAMPHIVWTARPDGNIDYLNRRWSEFTGLPATAGNDAWGTILHPDDAQPSRERWAVSLQSGAPFEMELRLLDRRQETYRWHLIRTVAVFDGSGAVARWFGTGTDIQEQKRAEESARYLSEASAALSSVVDYESTLQKVANLAVPYFADWSAVDMVNKDGSLRRLAVAHQDPSKIALVQELMRDYPPDPHAPVGAFAVFRTGKPEMISAIPDEMLVHGAKDERHLRLIRSLGLKSYICVPLTASGEVIGVLTFATAESGHGYTDADLTLATDLANRAAVAVENTRLYQALREADRRKDEFLATLAHELRNPLAPIRNSLQILKMPRVDTETVERSRDMMERQVHHLVRLVDDLLDVSRVMRGKIELRLEQVELASVVARAVETVQPLVESRGHDLSVRLPPESLPLKADPVRLAQVVGNLLTNATKYTEPGGRIWLTAERDRDTAVLRVRDSGIGIAPYMLARIFELFVQVDHAATRSQGGLGIGLTLVKNLVEMHNGTVEARSGGLGKGSEFIVRLPLSAQVLAEDHRPDAPQRVAPPVSSGYRLLVVDDNQDAANSLAMLLRLQGHDVRAAYSGMAALEMIKVEVPDVVFLDIGMPGMDGYEVARRLRQQPGLETVVLVALTGWGQKEDRRRTAEAGFNHHLVKPAEPKVIESLLADLRGTPSGSGL